MITLGERCKNPGNIRYVASQKWQGLDNPPSEQGFCRFVDISYGIRALMITLRTYIRKHNLTDVKSIISRYAPSSENDTRAYISHVNDILYSYNCGTDNIAFGTRQFFCLVSAIISIECSLSVSIYTIESIMHRFNLK